MRDSAIGVGQIGTKYGKGFHLATAHQSVKTELEGLALVALEILAQERATRLARINDFLLVVETLGIGCHDITSGCIRRFFNRNVIETTVVGHQIAARDGIGMLHLQLIQRAAFMSPRDMALGIEQDAVARAHDWHLRQVIGIIVAAHDLAQGFATVTEHVNLRQVTAQSPTADVIGGNLIYATLHNSYLDPLAAGELTRLGIVALVKRIDGKCTAGHHQNRHNHADEISHHLFHQFDLYNLITMISPLYCTGLDIHGLRAAASVKKCPPTGRTTIR